MTKTLLKKTYYIETKSYVNKTFYIVFIRVYTEKHVGFLLKKTIYSTTKYNFLYYFSSLSSSKAVLTLKLVHIHDKTSFILISKE